MIYATAQGNTAANMSLSKEDVLEASYASSPRHRRRPLYDNEEEVVAPSPSSSSPSSSLVLRRLLRHASVLPSPMRHSRSSVDSHLSTHRLRALTHIADETPECPHVYKQPWLILIIGIFAIVGTLTFAALYGYIIHVAYFTDDEARTTKMEALVKLADVVFNFLRVESQQLKDFLSPDAAKQKNILTFAGWALTGFFTLFAVFNFIFFTFNLVYRPRLGEVECKPRYQNVWAGVDGAATVLIVMEIGMAFYLSHLAFYPGKLPQEAEALEVKERVLTLSKVASLCFVVQLFLELSSKFYKFFFATRSEYDPVATPGFFSKVFTWIKHAGSYLYTGIATFCSSIYTWFSHLGSSQSEKKEEEEEEESGDKEEEDKEKEKEVDEGKHAPTPSFWSKVSTWIKHAASYLYKGIKRAGSYLYTRIATFCSWISTQFSHLGSSQPVEEESGDWEEEEKEKEKEVD